MIWEACSHVFQSHVTQTSLITAACLLILVAGCMPERQAASKESNMSSGNPKSPRQVYELLKQTGSEPILLKGSQGRTVIVAPKLVGRVMCAGFDGLEGTTNAFVNAEQLRKGFSSSGRGGWNNFGGEERIWFAPEGGKYGLFFIPGLEQNWDNYVMCKALHGLQYKVDQIDPDHHWVQFSATAQLINYQGRQFNLDVTRRVSVLDWCPFTNDRSISSDTEFTGFQTETWTKNIDDQVWDKETRPISMWTIGQFNCREHTVVMLPFKEGAKEPITTEYFRSHATGGKMPDNYWAVKPGCGLLKANGDVQTKLEMRAGPCLGRLGSIDLETFDLTLVEFQLYPELPYTASFLLPYDGNLLDGGAMSSFVSQGPIGSSIYELETCSPIMELAPGQSFLHLSRTYHIRGQREAIDKICQRYFNIDIKTLEAFDKQATGL
jgi:hypothetical protein